MIGVALAAILFVPMAFDLSPTKTTALATVECIGKSPGTECDPADLRAVGGVCNSDEFCVSVGCDLGAFCNSVRACGGGERPRYAYWNEGSDSCACGATTPGSYSLCSEVDASGEDLDAQLADAKTRLATRGVFFGTAPDEIPLEESIGLLVREAAGKRGCLLPFGAPLPPIEEREGAS